MIRATTIAVSLLAVPAAVAAERSFECAFDASSTINANAGISLPIVGSWIGDFDAATNPAGTQTRPGVLGGSGNVAIPFSAIVNPAVIATPSTSSNFLVPEPIWPDPSRPGGPAPSIASGTTPPTAATGVTPDLKAKAVDGVIPRARWARGNPDGSDLNKMIVPIKWVTIHHDGLDSPMTETSMDASAARIEWIRCGHRGRGFSDIGYHYVIDRDGRVWEGRSLRWQGAHVSKHNEQNIGILVMGNFDIQRPSQQQLDGMQKWVSTLLKRYRLEDGRVRTHGEWPGAKTACPGKHLQAAVANIRRKKTRWG